MPVEVQLMKLRMPETFLLLFDRNQSFKKYMLGRRDCEKLMAKHCVLG